MVRKVIERVLSVTGAVAVAVALAIGVTPPAAVAGPGRVAAAAPTAAPAKQSGPTSIKISGKDLATPLVVQQAAQPELFRSLLLQVSWLSAAPPQTTAPLAEKLGPKYTVVVLIKDTAHQTYDVYPLAAGGPRAYRPERQPSGKTTAGWFYGRLTMSEAMRLGGVPLPEKPDVVSGGIGGGTHLDLAKQEQAVGPGLDVLLADLRQLILLNGIVALLITLGLAGIAYLFRQRI